MITVNTLYYMLDNGNIITKEDKEEIDDDEYEDISLLKVLGLNHQKVYPSEFVFDIYCYIEYLDEDRDKAIKIIEEKIIEVFSTARNRMIKIVDNYDKIINKLQKG